MSGFNWVDYVILIIFFFSILAGFSRGFVKEIVSLITLIAAFAIAILFSNSLAKVFMGTEVVQGAVNEASNAIGISTAQPASYVAIGISFGILFAATSLAGTIIGYFINAIFQTGILGIGNRLLGGLFGLVRGYIFNLVLIFVVQLTPLGTQPWWLQSQLVNAYQPAVVWLGNIVSPSLANLKARFGQALQDATSGVQQGFSGFVQ